MSAELQPPLLALLENIKNHPDDDSRRFALADWVEQHGQDDAERARGHFIRLQCRRARPHPGNSLHEELEAQEQALRREYMAAWLGDWQPWITRPDNEAHWFQRGLLRPWVKGLQWLELEEVPQDTATWAWVDGLFILDLSCADDVERLAASPVLRGMTSLDFGPDSWGGNSEFGDAGARALASSPHLTQLRSLELGDTNLGPEGFRALVEVAAPEASDLFEADRLRLHDEQSHRRPGSSGAGESDPHDEPSLPLAHGELHRRRRCAGAGRGGSSGQPDRPRSGVEPDWPRGGASVGVLPLPLAVDQSAARHDGRPVPVGRIWGQGE